MQSLVVVTVIALFGMATAVPVLSSTQVVQGPSTKTTVVGPGGAGVIQAFAPGGTIVREEVSGYVASTGTHGIVGTYGTPIVNLGVVAAPGGYNLGLVNGGLAGHGGVLNYPGVLY